MWDGKKTIAQKIFYKAMEEIEKRTDSPAMQVFTKALNNLKPVQEVRSRRIGGATYRIPVPVSPNRRTFLAIKWLINAARSKKGKPMYMRLADEIILASKREGAAYKKREEMEKMAEANKAFAHYKW